LALLGLTGRMLNASVNVLSRSIVCRILEVACVIFLLQ
jgi:hypothetical protein